MGGRGTFGTKQEKLDRVAIITALAKQGTNIALENNQFTEAQMKNLSNSDLSILKDLIGRPEAKGVTINLTSKFTTENVGKAIIQKPTIKKGKKKAEQVIFVNRSIYKSRGIKYFNRVLNESGEGKSMKHLKIKKATPTTNKPPKPKSNKKKIIKPDHKKIDVDKGTNMLLDSLFD